MRASFVRDMDTNHTCVCVVCVTARFIYAIEMQDIRNVFYVRIVCGAAELFMEYSGELFFVRIYFYKRIV